MRMGKNELPIKIRADGAVARQQTDFGDATAYGVIGAEHFAMSAGTDIAPLLKGLENDLCQAPHWGYLIDGEVTVTYRDGTQERIGSGDVFFWPPGHTVKVERDAEFVLFSPQHEHTPVLDHINDQLAI
ncbi:MAG: cupin domain-containing protein [Candidatus Krumholzibacteriia bacterium]